MDALLAPEARQALEALFIGRSQASAGILIGHRRGLRFIIEKALPTAAGYYPSARTYARLSALTKNAIIGFFSFSSETGLWKMNPPPFAVGKVFLCPKGKAEARLSWRAFSLDYEGRFILKPVRLASLKQKKHGR
jgi:hypothetical protein